MLYTLDIGREQGSLGEKSPFKREKLKWTNVADPALFQFNT